MPLMNKRKGKMQQKKGTRMVNPRPGKIVDRYGMIGL
jgi:hypothetical protein